MCKPFAPNENDIVFSFRIPDLCGLETRIEIPRNRSLKERNLITKQTKLTKHTNSLAKPTKENPFRVFRTFRVFGVPFFSIPKQMDEWLRMIDPSMSLGSTLDVQALRSEWKWHCVFISNPGFMRAGNPNRNPPESEFEGEKFDHETHEIDETHEQLGKTNKEKSFSCISDLSCIWCSIFFNPETNGWMIMKEWPKHVIRMSPPWRIHSAGRNLVFDNGRDFSLRCYRTTCEGRRAGAVGTFVPTAAAIFRQEETPDGTFSYAEKQSLGSAKVLLHQRTRRGEFGDS